MTSLPLNASALSLNSAFLEVFPDAPILNLVDPKVGPTWGDLQSLPEWLKIQHGTATTP
jgi:hypothetical protein